MGHALSWRRMMSHIGHCRCFVMSGSLCIDQKFTIIGNIHCSLVTKKICQQNTREVLKKMVANTPFQLTSAFWPWPAQLPHSSTTPCLLVLIRECSVGTMFHHKWKYIVKILPFLLIASQETSESIRVWTARMFSFFWHLSLWSSLVGLVFFFFSNETLEFLSRIVLGVS